jgi:V/A-type H+-transporting ATPase subunit I
MRWVTIHLLRDDVRRLALVLARFGLFQPEAAGVPVQALPESPGEHYRERVVNARARLEKILHHLGLEFPHPAAPDPEALPTEDELQELDRWLGRLWRDCSACQEGMRRLKEERKHIDHLFQSLERFAALDMNLGLLQREGRVLDLRLGSVPQGNVKRLQDALALAGYLVQVFMRSEGTAHVVLAGLPNKGQDIETVLHAAGCRPIEIPPELRDHPQRVRSQLRSRLAEIERKMAGLHQRVRDTADQYAQRLEQACGRLTLASAYAGLSPALRARGSLCVVGGWVPKREVPRLGRRLREVLAERFVLSTREPRMEERSRVPSVLPHPAWLRPFAMLVTNYGTPRYGETDPTLLFALSFVAMFGMMFGDIGHGAVILIAGLVAHRQLRGFAPFVVMLGLSSMGFGYLYGSLFGYEGIVHPLWMSPLSDPGRMLRLALYWGIGFILLASALTIRNRLVEGRFQEALLDGRGLAGVALYVGMLYGAWAWLGEGRFGPAGTAAILGPLLVILVYHWRRIQVSAGEKALVVFMEGFETLMSYIANTLSFLRVAAFSLNHVALAVAVLTLAGMLDSAGHWITVVMGNLFILVLEGAIVAIQVLRLEYYEGFSRYFSGDGRSFQPLTLDGNRPR